MSPEGALQRLNELTARYALGARQKAQLQGLLSILERDRRAPSGVRSAEDAVDVHVADSLVALEVETVRAATTIADLGSGAGFPGLVLAIALPDSEVWLVESQGRKRLYLEDAIAEIGLENTRVVGARAEAWHEGADRHDVVTARALAPQPVVLEYAGPLLRTGGVLVDWRGARGRDEEEQAARAATRLGMRCSEIRRVAPFSGARDRHLHLYLKVSETPRTFPRRVGVASRRPLGAE
jgi:16S rRNA (guanine527-N7)-methyltransferase